MNSINTNIMALNPKNVINTFLGPVSIIIIIIQIITCVFLTLQAIKAYIAYSNAEDVTKKRHELKRMIGLIIGIVLVASAWPIIQAALKTVDTNQKFVLNAINFLPIVLPSLHLK
ncbi:Mbov_0395 family pilin-like conjugal transfer protein [Mycoplasma mycoides]|uniref:Mbov_0395 family pilin-like conjugal transfer protein n=1 Tax=Mycoplasma mycoides TaxID=2102 RepID=UPI003DA46AD9